MEERENRTRLLCQFLTDLTLERVGAENIRDIRYKTLDWLGCVIAAQTAPCAAPLARFTRAEGGAPRATAVGLGERTGAQSAAFYNGILSHALEYDDTNKIAITHPGAPVISAALAAAESLDASFETYALGVAAGYEAMIRLGGAVSPDHYTYWHTTGTCGAFAAAAAAAKIMGLTAKQTETAMGIASTMASGLVYVFGTDAKLVTVGNAARNGLAAAELARLGFTAPEDAFAAPKGYARAAGGKKDLSFMVPVPGDRLMLEDAYYKLHASCGHTHSALDALGSLMTEYGVTAGQVQSVEARVYRTALELCGAFRTDTEARAKFSLPFCLAVTLLRGQCTLAEFRPQLRGSPEVAALAARVHVAEEPSYTAAYPGLRTETVTLRLKDGRVLEKTVDLPEGRPSRERLEEKFYALAGMAIPRQDAEEILDMVRTLPGPAPVRTLGDLICTLRRN